ncbi:MAG: glycosyltransferase, partial [Rhodocyclaceae bacterium]|nr:glycosyltransferase [Rhodocyclaceae bacterium]
YEGFGLPLLEAMASGVPAVTSTCPTLTELARDIALQVDPSDIDALAQALQRGLEDDGWRQQAHLEGIKRAQQYTWARCIDQTLRLYASMWADDRRVDKRSAVHQKT